MNKKIVVTGVILIVIAIILGAFGAHGLRELVSVEKLATFEVGVRYEMYAGIILLIFGLNADKFSFSLKWISNLILVGIILFSGSIYLLSVQELTSMNLKFLGPITPVGGSLMIAGCTVLIVQLLRKPS